VTEHCEDCDQLPDEELAALALTGAAAAWNEIARRHTRRIVVVLLARGLTLETAEDLAQEVWVRLMEQQRAGRLQELRLPGLAIAQGRWLARESERKQRRRASLAGVPLAQEDEHSEWLLADPAADPEQQYAQQECLARVWREIERLPLRARQVFQAVYGADGRSHAEVAQELGLSVQRVRQILCEVRARARAALASQEREGRQ
jgi:RNA polymerase sigma factor (sigma-70 family)